MSKVVAESIRPHGDAGRCGRAIRLWLAVALLLVTAVVYAPVRHYAFLTYDDKDYVTDNAHVAAGLTRDDIVWAWKGVHQATWHPLTSLSHMLDCQLFGLDAGAHHLVNVGWHLLNTLVLFMVLARMTGQPWRSACVAGLFALHPLHVESVAWISERKDVLSAFFWLLTLGAYWRYVDRPSWRRYAVVLAACMAALLSKPMAVTLPCALLLLDVWPLRRVGWDAAGPAPRSFAVLVVEKAPLFALAIIVSAATFAIQRRAGATVPLSASPLAERTANALVAYAAYLWKVLWPTGLAVFYPFAAPLASQVLVAGALVFGVTAGVLRGARRYPYLLTGWFWYLGTLVPVIGLVRVGAQAMADRYTYLPLIGIFIIAVWGGADLLRRWPYRQVVCAVAAAVALASCTLLTSRQLAFWQDDLHLFQHALAVTRNNFMAHLIIGTALAEHGRYDEAGPHFSESMRLEPALDKVTYNMGVMFAERGERAVARRYYRTALLLNPDNAEAHLTLGLLLEADGDGAGAAAQYHEVIRIDPEMAGAHNNLAILLENMGQQDEAMTQYEAGVHLEPQHAELHCNLGAAFAGAGRWPEAVAEFRTALQLQPALAEARVGLAKALAHTRTSPQERGPTPSPQ